MKLQTYLKIILLTLAFTSSATLPVGFPLKIYEGVGFLAILSLLVGGGMRLGKYQRLPLLWGVFFFSSMIASAWGLNELWSRDLSMLEWAHGRYKPLINTIFHYTYLAFDIGLLVLTLHLLENRIVRLLDFCRWWLWGAVAAVGYGIALNMVILAGLPAWLLLRFGTVDFMTIGGVSVARTGPFVEGNYFGLYLLASVIINLYALKNFSNKFFRLALPVLVVGVVMTASPAAMMGVAAVVVVAILTGGVSSSVRNATLFAGVVVFGFVVQSGLFQAVVLDKFSLLLVGGVTDTKNVSLVQRLNESYHAWLLFLDYPWGVGMGNFGYFFGNYPDLYTWLLTDFQNFKPISNNVYMEVLSEHGLLVALLFIYLLYYKFIRLVRARELVVAAGFILVCIYFVAFPTFRLSLIWIFWAFVIFLGHDIAVDDQSTRL